MKYNKDAQCYFSINNELPFDTEQWLPKDKASTQTRFDRTLFKMNLMNKILNLMCDSINEIT